METFSSVAHLTSVRCLIDVTPICRWPLYQKDVQLAFLNGDFQEKVYMQPPTGYPHSSSQVYCLYHALYGLKQDPRA